VAIARAAQAKNAPVPAELSHDEVQAIGLANIRMMVDNHRAELGIEMYINLDHSPTVADAARPRPLRFNRPRSAIARPPSMSTGSFQIADRTTLPSHSISRGSPTSTDSRRPLAARGMLFPMPATQRPDLREQTVLIVGGSAGIGLATARRARPSESARWRRSPPRCRR
jgi:hypothetical protein